MPGTCTLQVPIGGSENEIVGNAIHDTCLPELWGYKLADAIRDLVIEIIRNALLMEKLNLFGSTLAMTQLEFLTMAGFLIPGSYSTAPAKLEEHLLFNAS